MNTKIIIPACNLNEFSHEQLGYYLEVFIEQQTDYNYKLSRLDEIDRNGVLDLMRQEYQFKFDAAVLMRTQIENAITQIESEQTINAG